MDNVVKNYWEISEEERKKDEQIVQGHQIWGLELKKKSNYGYVLLNVFVHICIVLASLTIISESNMSQSPGITLSIFLGSALTLELIYFVVKSSLNKAKN